MQTAKSPQNQPVMEFFQNKRVITDLSSQQIYDLLLHGAWNSEGQSISSAETNNDKNPDPEFDNIKQGDNAAGVNAFADIDFGKNITRILDVGGGKFDVCRNYMKKRNIELLVWDPYNRTAAHNLMIEKDVKTHPVDGATSMAILNVIAEPEVRIKHITTLKSALKNKGKAYFKVWPGEGSLRGSNRAVVNAYGFPGFQANSFAEVFLPEVQVVFGRKNVHLHPKVPNLIIAEKMNNKPTSLPEIEEILRAILPSPMIQPRGL